MFINSNPIKIILVSFYSLSALLALFTYNDYGIHIEEKFHRMNGLYWLNYISNVFGLSEIENITNLKMKGISDFSLSSVSYFNKYGIVFDVPMACIEILFNIEEIEDIYYLKHLFSFYIFLLSSLFFFKILQIRFNDFFLSFLGLFLYISSPRILGDSFLYKDILFLSFFTFTFYFLIISVRKLNYKNLLIFGIFTGLSLNLRIFAVIIPIIFIVIIFIKKSLPNKSFDKIKKSIFYLFCFFISLYIFWPYLWENPIDNFIQLFISLKDNLVNVKIFYNDTYISNRVLPDYYILNWIIISSPFLQTTFFILGYIYCLVRFIKRFMSIKEKSFQNDLWRGEKEQIDFLFLIFLTLFYFLFIFLNAPLYNGWRLVYFFNIFMVYFAISFLFNFKNFLRKKNSNNLIILIGIFLISYNVYSIIKIHPYQSLYFDNIISKNTKNKYEGDYHGLATKHFFIKLLDIDNREKINIAVASHTPVHRGLEAIQKNNRGKFNIVGQEYSKADYIFKNNISEVNSKLIKKYEIPKNFSKIYELKIEKILIYEMFKLKDN